MEPQSESCFYEVSGVHFAYPSVGRSRLATLFHQLTLSITKGESLVILGPSGVGKSTLLKIMAGILEPSRGKVNFQGVNLYKATLRESKVVRRRIGMTFQKGGLFDSLTCAENLRLPLREAWKLKRKTLDQKINKALKEVRLNDIEDHMVHEISGGMQKRLGIARALILSPEVVLYDEPTAGLDPVTSRAIMELILEVKKRHEMTIITVTSDISRAYQIADRIAFLYHGEIIELAPPKTIKNSKNPIVNRFVRGLPPEEAI